MRWSKLGNWSRIELLDGFSLPYMYYELMVYYGMEYYDMCGYNNIGICQQASPSSKSPLKVQSLKIIVLVGTVPRTLDRSVKFLTRL